MPAKRIGYHTEGNRCTDSVACYIYSDHDAVSFRDSGTARVVNYAGLVRGGTQRWIKMEITGNPRDKMMEAVESYIDGLQNGSEDLGLVRLKDAKYQAKVEEQKNIFRS